MTQSRLLHATAKPIRKSVQRLFSRKLRTGAMSAMLGISLTLTSCGFGSNSDDANSHDYFGYAIDDYLITTNVSTTVGFSSNAHQLVGRLYPGVYVNGPKGQRIPNSDLVQVRALPGAQQRVEYRISDKAVYSDGQPITCDSFLLAFVAASARPLFDSYIPLMDQVERVDCTPGSKLATVVFKEDYGDRWRFLFSGGSLLPAHAIAAKLNLSLEAFNQALQTYDANLLPDIAQVWNTGFDLQAFDPQLQVSSGPFFIESVGAQGEVTLSRNDKYYGEKPVLDKLVVWPKGTDLQKLATEGNLQIAEVDSVAETKWIDRNDPENIYDIEATAGVLTDHLILGSAGVFESKESRQAFAACVDQAAVARASSKSSGVTVDPVATRTIRARDSINQHLSDITDPRLGLDFDAARKLEGKTVRIGYFAPDARKAAMVESIRSSCAEAGITVEDASADFASIGNLPRTFENSYGTTFTTDGGADAMLQALDPQYSFDAVQHVSNDIDAVRSAEAASWDEVETIPLASQPRVFIVDRSVKNVVHNTDLYGIGWNLDRWGEDVIHN